MRHALIALQKHHITAQTAACHTPVKNCAQGHRVSQVTVIYAVNRPTGALAAKLLFPALLALMYHP